MRGVQKWKEFDLRTNLRRQWAKNSVDGAILRDGLRELRNELEGEMRGLL